MTEEFTMMIKNILDKAGLEISVEQIEAGLNVQGEKIPDEDPWLDEVIRKIEEERKNQSEPSGEGWSFKGSGKYYVLSGQAELEYSGRARKTYKGEVILLIKPDNSIVVHSTRGVNPVSYVARAEDIRLKGKDGKLTVAAGAGNDRLVLTFLRMSAFENLFEKTPLESVQPPAVRHGLVPIEMTDEEKALEARLRKLRIELAQREGISFLPAVYDNKTMHQLIRQKPKTLEELRQIKGFGTKRIERYAASVLDTINGGTGDQARA
jgi:superfamily II DNA helicase RecQ